MPNKTLFEVNEATNGLLESSETQEQNQFIIVKEESMDNFENDESQKLLWFDDYMEQKDM